MGGPGYKPSSAICSNSSHIQIRVPTSSSRFTFHQRLVHSIPSTCRHQAAHRRKPGMLEQTLNPGQLVAEWIDDRCVSCFNGLPESVVSSKTVAEFKRRLSEVDLSSVLKYDSILVLRKWLC